MLSDFRSRHRKESLHVRYHTLAISLDDPPHGAAHDGRNGHQANVISGVWSWFTIKTEQPDLQVGVYLRPSRTGSDPKYLSMEAWAYGISKDSKIAEQSWLLTKFLTADKDGGGWFMQEQGRPFPVKEFNQAPEMKQISPYWDMLLKALERSVAPATFLAVHTEVIRVINEHIRTLNQEQASVRETAANIRQEGQRIIDEFWVTEGK